jgi:pyruvate dehydrogenase E1 component alpha subunit
VYRAVCPAVQRARSGGGATFLECKTYRAEPHCGIIADGRNKEELAHWHSHEKDPIARFERQMIAEKALPVAEIEALHVEVERELQEAVEFARRSPYPTMESARTRLWAKGPMAS